MKIKTIIIGVVVIGAALIPVFSQEEGVTDWYFLRTAFPHHINLTWEHASDRSQSVSWRTDSTHPESLLQYCEAVSTPFFNDSVRLIKAESQRHESDDGTWFHHSAIAGNLKPETTYSYRVGHEGFWSEWSEFRTAPGGNQPFSFLYFGDVQRNIRSLGSRIIRQGVLECPDAGFMLFGGDLVHRGALNSRNWNEFFEAGGWIFRNLPLIATPGNHELDRDKPGSSLADNWFLNFAFPRNGPEGHEEETFYVDYNNVRIISLNLLKHRYTEDMNKMLQWLEDRLQEFSGDWVIVVHHFPMILCKARIEKPEIRFPEIKALYEKYSVPIVLTGHAHLYARGRIDGKFPVYVISVAGPYQNAIYFDDWIERAGTSIQLFQEIHVTPDTLHYTSKTILGETYDEFIITKDNTGRFEFNQNTGLMPEYLVPPEDFENRYDEEIVRIYRAERDKYLKRK